MTDIHADFDEVQPRCDICGEPQPRVGEDWNGDTGNHITCEKYKASGVGVFTLQSFDQIKP